MGQPILLYDADCGFCTRVAGYLSRAGLRAAIAPLQSHDLAAVGVDVQRAKLEIPFVAQHGYVSYGAAAIADVLRTGNGVSRLAAKLLDAWPIRHLAAGSYRIIARYRSRLPGGGESCKFMTS